MKEKNLTHSVYLCGDYNIDLLNVKNKKPYYNYFDDVVSNSFFLKFTLSTRLADYSSTLIDNLFTNDMDKACISDIISFKCYIIK